MKGNNMTHELTTAIQIIDEEIKRTNDYRLRALLDLYNYDMEFPKEFITAVEEQICKECARICWKGIGIAR